MVGFPITLGHFSTGICEGDEDGPAPGALLDDLEQLAPAFGGEAMEPPVVEDQQGDPGEPLYETLMGARHQHRRCPGPYRGRLQASRRPAGMDTAITRPSH